MGTRLLHLLCFSLAAAGVTACGDNLSGTTDAPRTDARQTADAAEIDAPQFDAPPASTYSATISVQEVSVANIPALGQGLQITATFLEDQTAVHPVFDEDPASPFGCKAWEYTAAEAAFPGLDEGAIQITATDGAPVIPTCVFVPGTGYACPDPGSSDTGGGTLAMVTAQTTSFTVPGGSAATFDAADVGRYLRLADTGVPALNTAFPIVARPSATTVVLALAGTNLTLPAGASFTTVAGVGPIPGVADPGFLGDADEITVALTAGGGGHFESFSKTFAAAGGGVGDDYTLDTASTALVSAIPVDGSSFTVGCDGAGGTCGTSLGAILQITTTDGSIAGLPPYVMPAPATKRVVVRCANLGAQSLTVPAAASAYLMTSGATRIQAAFIRTNLQLGSNTAPPGASYTIVAGHNTVGFTSP